MWVHRRSEEPSCTSTECYWKKSKLSRVGSSLKYLTAKELSKGNPEYPMLAGSPDGIFEDGILEMKCPLNDKTLYELHKKWKCY